MKKILCTSLFLVTLFLSVLSASGSQNGSPTDDSSSRTLKIDRIAPREVKFVTISTFAIPGISVSAYTASKRECGKDDGITASGVLVHDGVIACNFLPFGTKVRIPGMYGKKVFTVYDRMAKKNMNNVDIYVKHVNTAWQIGRSDQTIVVIN